MLYLLDTNHWIAFLKGFDKSLGVRIERAASDQVVTCSIVRAELLHGAEKYGNREARVKLINPTLGPYNSFGFDDAAAVKYARIRHAPEVVGKPIGHFFVFGITNRFKTYDSRSTYRTKCHDLCQFDWPTNCWWRRMMKEK